MKGKKIFCIGAIVLMILLAVGPAVNGMVVDNLIDNESLSTNNDGYDLTVVVEDCHYVGIDESSNYVIYEISYHFENEGNTDFPGEELEHIMKHKQYEINRWRKSISVCRSKSRAPTIKEYVFIPADKEEYLAGREFFLHVDFDDYNPDNDKGLGFGRFGSESNDYVPTYGQIKSVMGLMAERLRNYEKKEMGGLFSPLTNRLGWVYELYSLVTEVIKQGLRLDYEALLIGVTVTTQVYIILDWVVKFEAFLMAPNPLTLDLMLADTAIALAALMAVYEILVLHHGIDQLINVWHAFSNAVNNTIDYIKSRPWFNPIKLVYGNLDGKGLGGKVVTVKCREQEKKCKINYYFEDLDPESMGEKAWQIHDCTVTASANGFKTKKSPKILSWTFSEGVMRYDFYLKPDKARSITIFQLLNEILERWLSFIKPSLI
jgi:hypothetical protein